VAPTRVKGAIFIITEVAPAQVPTIISTVLSSIAPYNISSI